MARLRHAFAKQTHATPVAILRRTMPVSRKKLQANRENAQKSTGPRTRRGKDRVSRNALRHGLLAQAALIPGEDPEPFIALHAELKAHFDPVGTVEDVLVDLVVSYLWRVRRIAQVEAGLY